APDLRRERLAPRLALGGFLVQCRGHARRSATFRNTADDDGVLERRLAKSNFVTELNHLRALRPGSVHVDFAAVDGVSRQRPRLVEPGRPQPFVETNAFVPFSLVVHDSQFTRPDPRARARIDSRPIPAAARLENAC